MRGRTRDGRHAGEQPGRPGAPAQRRVDRAPAARVSSAIGPARRRGRRRRWPPRRTSSRPRRAGARRPDRAALGDERPNELAELDDAGRVEPVHRLVEDEQLGVAQEAAGDAEPLAHAERVRAHAVVGAAGQPDALERPVDAPVRGAVARRRVHLEVLAAGEVGMEARLLDDGADTRERGRPAAGRSWPSRRMRPLVGRARPRRSRMSVVCRRRCGRGSRTRSRAAPRGRWTRAPPGSPKRFPRPCVSMAREVMAATLRRAAAAPPRPPGPSRARALIRSD